MMQKVIDSIDRKTAPPVNEIKKVDVKRLTEYNLNNYMPVYHINAGTQDLVKIELIFPAGMWQQKSPLMSGVASAMLQEGTSKYSSTRTPAIVD